MKRIYLELSSQVKRCGSSTSNKEKERERKRKKEWMDYSTHSSLSRD
jgi:hypothetical protein